MQTSFRNNFTLLEILLATTVLLTVTGLVSMVICLIPGSWRDMDELSSRTMKLAALDRIADRVIRNAVPMTWNNSKHEKFPVFKGDPQLMITAYRTRMAENCAGIAFLALGFRDGNLVAQFRSEPIVWKEKKDANPATLTEEILLTDIEEFSFLYPVWKNGKLEWEEDWDEDARPYLPRAIGWKIKFKDGREVKYLRRTAGNSLNTSYGRRADEWKK